MERIEDIDLEAETEALERHGDHTLYTFDEYGRLMCYARITAGTRQAEKEPAGYALAIFEGGDDMREFEEHDGKDFPDLKTTLENVGAIWKGRKIWYERDGGVPGVDDGITFDELRGASMLAGFRRQLERNMRVRGIDPEGGQVERDARTIAEAETRPYVPSLFDLFEESIVEGVNRLESDGVEREARNAWERGMYREMLHAMKD